MEFLISRDAKHIPHSAEAWPYDWADGILTLRAALGVNDVYGFIIR